MTVLTQFILVLSLILAISGFLAASIAVYVLAFAVEYLAKQNGG